MVEPRLDVSSQALASVSSLRLEIGKGGGALTGPQTELTQASRCARQERKSDFQGCQTPEAPEGLCLGQL